MFDDFSIISTTVPKPPELMIRTHESEQQPQSKVIHEQQEHDKHPSGTLTPSAIVHYPSCAGRVQQVIDEVAICHLALPSVTHLLHILLPLQHQIPRRCRSTRAIFLLQDGRWRIQLLRQCPLPSISKPLQKPVMIPLMAAVSFFVPGGLPVVGTDGIPLQRLTLHDIERVDCSRILAQKHGYSAMWQAEENTLPSPNPRQSAMLVDSLQLTPEESAISLSSHNSHHAPTAVERPSDHLTADLVGPFITILFFTSLISLFADSASSPSPSPSRPLPSPPVIPSQRCVDAFIFDEEVSNTFLDRNGLKCVVRSHEAKFRGFEVLKKGRCVTVFSSAHSSGWTNRGAMARLSFLPLYSPRHDSTTTVNLLTLQKGSSRPSPVPQSTPPLLPTPSSTVQKPLHAVPVFHFQVFDAGIPAPSPNITATPSSYVVHELGIAPPVPFTQDSTIGTDTGRTEAACPSPNSFNREW
ncbi:hypothetical protein BLNAU_24476 [Blattamonas nauphoetae]|uniref:Uncharacterized protein n=1 Tax=Blattamonas nauphoetae TaxID=2049346 RepID=A0ABQ9WMA4_9EUKA|nr:hypothetical protein BLNAU_24476 [Blattamonas nauphoetae]